MLEQILPEILKLGAPGLIISFLVYALMRADKREEGYAQDRKEYEKKIGELYELRISLSEKIVVAMTDTTKALDGIRQEIALSRRQQ